MVSLMITASIPNPEPSPIKFKIRTLAETARGDHFFFLINIERV